MATKVRVTPEEAGQLYVDRLSASRDRIELGVNNVTVSPTLKASQSEDKMLAGITEAVKSGKWAKSLKAVTLEDWRKAFIEKGLDRIASGALNAQPKMVAFFEKLFAHQDRLLDDINKMPDITLEHSINRMTAWVRGMAKYDNN